MRCNIFLLNTFTAFTAAVRLVDTVDFAASVSIAFATLSTAIYSSSL